MRPLLLCVMATAVLAALFLGIGSVCPGDEAAGQRAWTATAGEAAGLDAADVPEPVKRLNLLERRRLGLTIRNVKPIVERLQAEGQITEETPPSTAAVMVFEELVSADPKAYADASIDWDAVLEFLEKLIPLIIAIISLF